MQLRRCRGAEFDLVAGLRGVVQHQLPAVWGAQEHVGGVGQEALRCFVGRVEIELLDDVLSRDRKSVV